MTTTPTTKIPPAFTAWVDALSRQRDAGIRYARSETDNNMDVWTGTDYDLDAAYEEWCEYAGEHYLCLDCAGPSFDGYAYCWDHMEADKRAEWSEWSVAHPSSTV